jgi:hypothetical protein
VVHCVIVVIPLVGLYWFISYFFKNDSEDTRAKIVWAVNNLLMYNIIVCTIHFAILTSVLGVIDSFISSSIVIIQIIFFGLFIFLRINTLKFYRAYDGVKGPGIKIPYFNKTF